MRVNIQPQWGKLTTWYWDNYNEVGKGIHTDTSIWDILERDYGAKKVHFGIFGGKLGRQKEFTVEFPSEKEYMWFLLHWSD